MCHMLVKAGFSYWLNYCEIHKKINKWSMEIIIASLQLSPFTSEQKWRDVND